MRKTLRCALIWILMLALPAQAMAALGMQLCEQVHRSGTQMVMVEHGAHADMAADSGHAGHQQDTTLASSDAPAGASLCTLCAFCVGTAAPGQLFSGDLSLALHRARTGLAGASRRRCFRHPRTPSTPASRLSPVDSVALRRL